MPGRPLIPEDALRGTRYVRPDLARRRAILRETLDAFAAARPPDRYHRLAETNLARWRAARATAAADPRAEGLDLRVERGDWGAVTARLTREHGVCFAALNMANAFVPGGGYVEGSLAQEENLFRRTDCHFRIGPEEYDASQDRYRPAFTRLLQAADGRVHLDVDRPRVCIRGPEDRARADLGYPWLPDDEVFPFYELRAAAQDLRDGSPFDESEARRRIAAQLDTLVDRGVRHAVLSAFGCGAFENPADRVAALYRDEIERRRARFDVLAFAIFHAGYGPDNFTPFRDAFAG